MKMDVWGAYYEQALKLQTRIKDLEAISEDIQSKISKCNKDAEGVTEGIVNLNWRLDQLTKEYTEAKQEAK